MSLFIPYIFAVLLGILLAFATSPYYVIALLFLSLSGLFFLITNAKSAKQAFWIGFWFGAGYFSAHLYWFAFPLIDAKPLIWLIKFIILSLPFLFSIYFALAAVAFYIIDKNSLIIFSLFFTVVEWLLGFSLPWNLFAYSWSFSLEVMQITSVVGIYGLTFITIFCAAAPAACFYSRSYKAYVIAIILLASMFFWGKIRLNNAEQKYHQQALVRIVQGNISKDKFDDLELSKSALIKYINLTRSFGFEKLTHVIWPESAVPFVVDKNNKSLLNAIQYAIPKFLITGGLSWEDDKMHNSLFVMGNSGEIVDYYDKYRLVPFSEFIPYLSTIAKFVPKAAGILGNFTSGKERNKIISLTDTPSFTPLICYEAIFPGKVISKKNRAQWLVNITNDVWFKTNLGNYQHFAISRVRAIEEGVPLIRAANSGISAVIDSYGRIIKYLPADSEGFIDTQIPQSLSEPTIYSQYINNNFTVIIVAISILALSIYKIRKRQYK